MEWWAAAPTTPSSRITSPTVGMSTRTTADISFFPIFFSLELRFSSFENLMGATFSETFFFSNGAVVAGRIDGREGFDTLDYSAWTTLATVDLHRRDNFE